MTPTNELREELREMLAETIPPGGIDSDTLFTEEQINSLLVKSVNVYMSKAGAESGSAPYEEQWLESHSSVWRSTLSPALRPDLNPAEQAE